MRVLIQRAEMNIPVKTGRFLARDGRVSRGFPRRAVRAYALHLVLLVGFAAPERLMGQPLSEPPTERRTLTALRLAEDETIQLDGRLDEPVWRNAQPATDFLQQDPVNGAPATERTEVRIVYEQQRLYIGLIAYDSEPDSLLANQMQRDQSFEADDRFMWSIDPYFDGRTGYFFEINPVGAMGDGLLQQSQGTTSTNRSWDGIWNARVDRGNGGWTAEIEIPFRTLNFDPTALAWGINFQRTVRRTNEESLWSGWARNQGLSSMTHAGRLVGLANINQGLGLDVKPYVLGTATGSPRTGAPALRGAVDAGIDLFYSLTPALRANFTVNTDFAETEVDSRLVNLTRFPLRFPEQREFFLEGSSFLNFASGMSQQAEAFFSRRIGLNDGRPQPIDFGTKLTGQAGRQDIGLLHVRTRETEDAPGEDFAAIRIRRRVLAQSYVGMIYTWRHARDGGPHRQTAGVDFNLATSTFLGAQNVAFGGYLVENTTPLDTGDGTSYGLRLNFPNDPWSGLVSFRELQENYDPALGFVQRNGVRRLNPVVRFSPRPADHPFIRSFTFGNNMRVFWDLQNELITREIRLTVFQVEFHSSDNVRVRVIPTFERLERNFKIHEGIVLPSGNTYDFTRYEIELRTASRRKLAVQSSYQWGSFFSGSRRELLLSAGIRPRSGIALSLDGEWNQIDLPEGSFSTQLFRSVVNAQPSPWISFVSNLQYDTVSRTLGWQFRFRWISRPGDDVYFVYTHNWIDDEPHTFRTLERKAAVKIVRTYGF